MTFLLTQVTGPMQRICRLGAGSRGRIARAIQRAREIGRETMHRKTVPFIYYVVDMFYKYTPNVSISSS